MRTRRAANHSGVTLVEVLVTIGIFTVLTIVALFNYTLSNDVAKLESAATEVALSLREAQVWTIAAREYPPGSNTFDNGFGLYFNHVFNDNFIFFIDDWKNLNKEYEYDGNQNCGSSMECVSQTQLRSGYVITDLCAGSDSSSVSCGQADLHISFKRPALGATITSQNTKYAHAEIEISSPKGLKRMIVVENTGTVTVK